MSRGGLPELSVVVVNHRTAAESLRCVESLRMAFSRERIAGEVVLVDCGSGPEEARALRDAPADRLVLLEENRGYSGGVNAGMARARARRLILSNADVIYRPDSLEPLLAAIEDPRVGAAAPLAVWDEEGRLRLPPGFAPGFRRDLAQRTAGRWAGRDDRRFQSFARETLALWERGGAARHLSGAVLAARRDVFDRVGRFDERFPFEYEETEWEERVRRSRLELRFVPQSRVRHLWARSAARNPRAQARRVASETVYRRMRYGPVARALLSRPAPPRLLEAARLMEPIVPAAPGMLVALSPNRSRIPFAAADLARGFRLSDDIAANLPPGPWYFTVFSAADGRPRSTSVWEPPS